MDQTADISNWRKLLSELSESDGIIRGDRLKEFSTLLEHLTPETAPRLQKEHDACNLKTSKCLSELFDKIDLSDKQLLCAFLKLTISYGYFRMAQITYSSNELLVEPAQDSTLFPEIKKVKWYEMSPLLPPAGTLGWKMIMLSGMVKEEKELMQTCLDLCIQKLHFYAVLMTIDRYQRYASEIKRSGEKVAEKLLELIRDVGYDAECMIGLDSSLFNLLAPFTDEAQKIAIVDAVVQDLFKPYHFQREAREVEFDQLYRLINSHFINKSNLQEVLIDKLLEHLKCNIIRRKRRHSVETSQEEGIVSLEGLIDSIREGKKLLDLTPSIDSLNITNKSFKTSYLSYWIKVTTRILPQRILTAGNSVKIMSTCSIILLATSNLLNPELIDQLSFLTARTIDATGQNKLEKLFKTCSPVFLVDLTKTFSERTQLISSFSTPLQTIYSSYISRYLRFSLFKGAKFDSSELVQYIEFICDDSLEKGSARLLQYIFLKQLANCIGVYKDRETNKLLDTYLNCARKCAKNLYKFIKRNIATVTETDEEEQQPLNRDQELPSEVLEYEMKKALVVDALTSVIRIAIKREDRTLIDSYSELLLKLFSVVNTETLKICEITKYGRNSSSRPITSHLSRLLKLYVEHKDLIKAYLNYDLVENISSSIFAKEFLIGCPTSSGDALKQRKTQYNHIKKSLKALTEQAGKSTQVYQTIINKQYNYAIDQSLSSDMQRERPCCRTYITQMRTLSSISQMVLSNCSPEIYKSSLSNIIEALEKCDPLDHPKVLYLLALVESVVPKADSKENPRMNIFKNDLSRLSCSLVRITKTVELGPSIHAFSKSGSHKSSRAIQCCTYANCLQIFTTIVARCPAKLMNSIIPDALDMCISSNLFQYAKYSAKLQGFFVQLASAISSLLQSISMTMKEEDIFKTSLPVFLSMFSQLLCCIILASDRRKLESLSNGVVPNGHARSNDDEPDDLTHDNAKSSTREYEDQLELLAMDSAKTLNNLSYFRVKIVDYAPHLISSYIKDMQRASCPDSVRLHLNEGIFRIFNLIDAHQKERQEDVFETGDQRKISAGRASGDLLEMIHARLDQASREIFRDMYENYSKFHKYRGRC